MARGRPLVLGVDSSTQSTKVEARDLESGDVLGSGRAGHPEVAPPVSEQDPESWWAALVQATAQLGPLREDVVALSIAGQQHGLVLLDRAGKPVRPAKLWNDTTSASSADRLVAEMGPQWWARGCGSVPVAAFTVAKLAWVAEHEPESLEAAAFVMLPHDYLTWRATGEHVTDRGDASGTGWFDPVRNVYLDSHWAAAGTDLGLDRLPRVLEPSETAGVLRADAARELGLRSDVVVGPGTGDNMAAALGLGLRSGDVVISLGTSGTVYAVSDAVTADASGSVAGFADATGRFLPLVCTLNATRVTDTMARLIGAEREEFAALALAAGAADGPTLLPYLDGERTPNLPDATGALLGLTNGTTREELARAAHDGVLCGLLDGVDALLAHDVVLDGRRFLVGGGARSAAYRQRCADLSGATITVPDDDETVATGAALQAAVVFLGSDAAEVAAAWNCGAGTEIPPAHDDGAAVRIRYAQARQAASPMVPGVNKSTSGG